MTSSWGGQRYPPFAFTEQCVAMLSGVLKSKRAIETNIAIMRTFVALPAYAVAPRRQEEAHALQCTTVC